MDAIIKDVNEGWEEDGKRTHFRGSDDYLRQKVNEKSACDSARHFIFGNSSTSIYRGPLPPSSMPTSFRRVKETTWSLPKASQVFTCIVRCNFVLTFIPLRRG